MQSRSPSLPTSLPALLLFFTFSVVNAAAVVPPTLSWTFDNCPTGYDGGCADLEFCEIHGQDVFGYRLVGESDCGLRTASIIRVNKGRKYLLNLHNTASEPSNLHTHGLHVSGDGNSDDITRVADPGQCLSYTYDIGSYHLGGTFWYHDHKHELSKRHVDGGALGMIIVEDDGGDLPNDNGVQTFATNKNFELPLIAMAISNNDVYANGQLSPANFDVLPETWYRLRLVSVETSADIMDVSVNGCEARAVAFDGVWRSTVPGPASSLFQLTGASRIDLAIYCSSKGALLFNDNTIALFNVLTGQNPAISTPFVEGSLRGTSGQTWNSRLNLASGHYLEDLRNAQVVDNKYEINMSGGNINGENWDPNVELTTMQYDSIQEWTLKGTGAHPFHLHVWHMQVVTPGGCDHHEFGQFYDVISSSDDCVVRFRMADIAGRVVMHCHIFKHEDNGAMTWIQVANGPDIDYSNMDYCSRGGCVSDGSCTPLALNQCNTNEGTDNCGSSCTLGTTSACDNANEVCVDNRCVGTQSCAAIGESCIDDTDCCSNRCSGGKKRDRICF